MRSDILNSNATRMKNAYEPLESSNRNDPGKRSPHAFNAFYSRKNLAKQFELKNRTFVGELYHVHSARATGNGADPIPLHIPRTQFPKSSYHQNGKNYVTLGYTQRFRSIFYMLIALVPGDA